MDRLSRTLLYLSARLGYREATKLLVNRGALLSAVDNIGRIARNLVEEKGLERTIKAIDNEPSTGYIFNGRLILL